MKKSANKAIAVILVLILALSCVEVAFAGDGSGIKSTFAKAENLDISDLVANVKGTETVNFADSKAYKGEFKMYTRTTGFHGILMGEEPINPDHISAVSFDQDEIIAPDPDDAASNIVGHSTAVELPAKGSVLIVAGADQNSDKGVTFGLYKDAQMTQPVEAEEYADVDEGNYVVLQVPEAGTYYLGAYATNSKVDPQEFVSNVYMLAYYINGEIDGDVSITNLYTTSSGSIGIEYNYDANQPEEYEQLNLEVWRTFSENGKYQKIDSKELDADGSRVYYDRTAPVGDTYYYKLRLCADDSLYSEFSTVKSIKVSTPLELKKDSVSIGAGYSKTLFSSRYYGTGLVCCRVEPRMYSAYNKGKGKNYDLYLALYNESGEKIKGIYTSENGWAHIFLDEDSIVQGEKFYFKIYNKSKYKYTIDYTAKKYGSAITSMSIPLKLSVQAEKSKKISVTNTQPLGGLKHINWRSSNTQIATVDRGGWVYAKKPGVCTITAELYNGKTYKCKVTVTNPPPRMNYKAYILNKNQKIKLDVKYTDKTERWSSSNRKVATVSSNGTVTAKGVGVCTITGKIGSKKYTCKIIVKPR